MDSTNNIEENNQRGGFLFLRSFVEVVEAIKDQRLQYEFLMAVITYGLDRKEPEFENELLNIAWISTRRNIESGWKKSDSGKMGGGQIGNQNARKDKTSKNEQKPTQTNNKNTNRNMNKNKNMNITISDSLNPLSVAPMEGRTSTGLETDSLGLPKLFLPNE